VKSRVRDLKIEMGHRGKRKTEAPESGGKEITSGTYSKIRTRMRKTTRSEELRQLVHTNISTDIGVTFNPTKVHGEDGTGLRKSRAY